MNDRAFGGMAGRAKGKAEILIRKAARNALRIFWILPVQRRRVCFESYRGKSYNCNPKAISDYLREHFPGRYEIVWAFQNPQDFAELKKEGIRVVRYQSAEWYRLCITAGTVIFNWNGLSYMPRRRNQLVINTWHAGGAYKRTGYGAICRDPLHEWLHTVNPTEQIGVYLTSSELFTRYNIREAYHFGGKILKSGSPRNDLFFSRERTERAAARVREAFGIGADTGIILWAPTYRMDAAALSARGSGTELPREEVIRAYSESTGRKAVILMRRHYLDRDGRKPEAGELDAGEYPDMQDLLAAADILITDYSSSIWDFALLGRPAFCYIPDLLEYEKNDRGFFTPPEEWPAEICRTEEALIQGIRAADPAVSAKRAAAYLKKAGSFESGRACEIAARAIRKYGGRGL